MKSVQIARAIREYPFWPYLWRHRGRYAIGLAALVVVDAINVAVPLALKAGIDALGPGDHGRVLQCAAWVFGLHLAQAVGRYLWRMYLIGTSHRIAAELRTELYGHLQRLPLSYYQKVRTGDLMSRATNDVEAIRMAVGPGILVSVDAVLMLVMIVPAMVALSWKLSLLAFAFYPLVPWLTAKLGDRIDQLFESLQRRMSDLGAFAQETFGGIRLIKSLVLECHMRDRFAAMSDDYHREGRRLATYQAGFSPALSLITQMGTLLILLVGGLDVVAGAITVGTFVALQRFVVQLSWPMEAVGWTVTMHREGAAAHRRLREVLGVTKASDVTAVTEPARAASGMLHIDGLRFSYGGTNAFRMALDGLEVESGKKIGIVGPVGAGKTTLFNLIMRLYEPTPGQIRLEGRDICSIPVAELRSRVACVEQPAFLFSETVAANLRLGARQSLDEAALREAASDAAVLDEVLRLEGGWDTLLRERASNLSGGQKQRLALARALLRQPQLLLLDDCFSAVDVAIEERILDTLFRNRGEMTVLFASHRLSVMPRLDEIWLFDRGRLVARGTHSDLLVSEPLYRTLWEKSERQRPEPPTHSQITQPGWV